jgi:hypothetical protein
LAAAKNKDAPTVNITWISKIGITHKILKVMGILKKRKNKTKIDRAKAKSISFEIMAEITNIDLGK